MHLDERAEHPDLMKGFELVYNALEAQLDVNDSHDADLDKLTEAVVKHNEAMGHVINAGKLTNNTINTHRKILDQYLEMFDCLEKRIALLEAELERRTDDGK